MFSGYSSCCNPGGQWPNSLATKEDSAAGYRKLNKSEIMHVDLPCESRSFEAL